MREGKGKNATETFIKTTELVQGDRIIFQAQIADENGSPISNASYELSISGPESNSISGTSSGNTGFSEATWATQSPNRKGVGGTTVGSYVAAVNGLTAGGYTWDAVMLEVSFSISP